MVKVLLIDDDIELCELLTEYLESEGFLVVAVHDGATGSEEATKSEYQLILLDVTLPRMNGFDVLKKIRRISSIPVLMLTARGDEMDRIIGLEIGADDYLPKPFNHRELTARMRAVLRRSEPEQGNTPIAAQFQLEDVQLNLQNRETFRGGEMVELTATEFMVLRTLMEKAGTLISREELTQSALGRRMFESDRAIDMHVSKVRKKLGPKPDGSPRFKTVRGAGYFYII